MSDARSWWTEEVVAAIRDIRERGTYRADETAALRRLVWAAGHDAPEETERLLAREFGEKVAAVCDLLGGEYVEAVAWLRQFADELGKGLTFNQLMADAISFLQTGRCIREPGGGSFDWENAFDDNKDKFWEKFQTATGIAPPAQEDMDSRSMYLCSCG